MSAFIVSKPHIDRIVSTAIAWDRRDHWLMDNLTPDQFGSVLWTENVKSVEYRYPDTAETHSGYPGPVSFERTEAAEYHHTSRLNYVLSPVQMLKAVQCLKYQSCEHPTWEQSAAYKFCEAMESAAINRLPGYDDAPWAWNE